MIFSSTKQSSNFSRLTFLIYGVSGSGKTSLAKTIKEKTLIISAESGLLPLRDVEIDVFDIANNGKPINDPSERLKRLQQIYTYLAKEKNDYKWIFIDSLSEIAQIVHEDLAAKHQGSKDSFAIWGEYLKKMRNIIKLFRDLSPYNVVMTALEDIDKDEIGRRFANVQLQGKIALECQAYFDFVFNMKSIMADDKIQRYLVTQASNSLVAKDRSGSLDKFEMPDLDNIKNKIFNISKENVDANK